MNTCLLNFNENCVRQEKNQSYLPNICFIMTSPRRRYKTCLPNEEETPYNRTMTTESKIEKLDVTLPNQEDSGKLAFILLNVFTEVECLEWIELTEKRGYSPALVNVGTHEILMTDVRNNDRCIIDDVDLAKKLFDRLRAHLPEIWKEHQIVGLNERLRFLRYDPGQKFERHMGAYDRSFDLELPSVYISFD